MASRKRKSKKAEDGLRSIALRGMGRGALWVGRMAGVPFMVVLIYVGGSWCLWQYAARGGVRPSDPKTDAASCPWLAPRDVAEINSAVRFGKRASMYDRDICNNVAERYRGNPWVERVVGVRRKFPNSVEVTLAVRKPFAYVRSNGRFILVDRSGCRLPVRSSAQSDGDYPTIEGIRGSAPATGRRWAGRPLQDALDLAGMLQRTLEGRGAAMRLAAVEVTEEKGSVDDLPQLMARTDSGMVIDWGSVSDTSTALFPSAEEKCRELERVLDEEVSDPAAIHSVVMRYKGMVTPTLRRGWTVSGPSGDAGGTGGGR